MKTTNEAKKSLSPPISPKREGRLVTLRFSISTYGPTSKWYSKYEFGFTNISIMALDVGSILSIVKSLDSVII